MTHTVYIDIPDRAARASASLTQAPSPRLVHRCDETLSFAFMAVSGTVGPIEGWEEGRAILRLTPEGDILLLDIALTSNGEAGTARRYAADWTAATMTSPALRAVLKDRTTALVCICEVMWIAAGKVNRVSFEISVFPAFNQPDDGAPPVEDPASEGWLDARALRFDKAQVLTLEQRIQALANLGIIIAEDGTLTLPTGHWDTFNRPLE